MSVRNYVTSRPFPIEVWSKSRNVKCDCTVVYSQNRASVIVDCIQHGMCLADKICEQIASR